MDPIKNLQRQHWPPGIAADATTAPLVTGEGQPRDRRCVDVNIWNFTDHGDNIAAAQSALASSRPRVTRSTDTLTLSRAASRPRRRSLTIRAAKTYKVRQVQTKEFF